ncbi:MAG: ATP-binding cassette domain-containing protein, partial [Firmicutes bacterium]|nr:ATP-binding cassette domain-containing protein [Bacillota bacterium]
TTKVINEICFGAENLKMDPKKIKERAKWAMDVVTMTGYDDRPPTMLSGGQKQRVAIAAALTMGPDILVLDEPTSQLDPVGTGEVFRVIQMLKDYYGMTIVMITHNSEEIARFADRVLVLNKGEVLAQGTPREIFGDIETLKKAWVSAPQSSMVAMTMAAEGEEMTEELPITLDEGIEYLNKHFAKVVVK